MRARWSRVAAVLLLGGLLAGCQVAVAGTAGVSSADQETANRRAEQRAAVDAALAELGQAPALALKSTTQDAEQQFRVTRGGTAFGGLPLDGRVVQVTAVGGQFYLQADADYWKAHAIDEGTQFGTNWVRSLGSELPFDPGARPSNSSDDSVLVWARTASTSMSGSWPIESRWLADESAVPADSGDLGPEHEAVPAIAAATTSARNLMAF